MRTKFPVPNLQYSSASHLSGIRILWFLEILGIQIGWVSSTLCHLVHSHHGILPVNRITFWTNKWFHPFSGGIRQRPSPKHRISRQEVFEDGLTDPKFTAHPIPGNQNRIVDLQQIPVAAELIPFGQMTCSDALLWQTHLPEEWWSPNCNSPDAATLLSRPVFGKSAGAPNPG